MDLFWTPQAIADLSAIRDYIALDSDWYAQIFTERVYMQVEQLAQYPKLGRIVPEFSQENLREVIYDNYRVIYLLQENAIHILTVFHSARNLDINDLPMK